MRTCWAEHPLDRPSFTEIREILEDLMAENRDYLVLEDIDVPLSASDSSSIPNCPDLFSGEMMPSQAARQVHNNGFFSRMSLLLYLEFSHLFASSTQKKYKAAIAWLFTIHMGIRESMRWHYIKVNSIPLKWRLTYQNPIDSFWDIAFWNKQDVFS